MAKPVKPASIKSVFKWFLKPFPPKVKKDAAVVLNCKPGERFQYYYHLHRHRHLWKSILIILSGLICLVLAVFFAFFPGPATPFWFIGFALISSRMLLVARIIDKIELMVSKFLGNETWRRITGIVLTTGTFIGAGIGTYMMVDKFLPIPGAIAVAVVSAIGAAMAFYKVYLIFSTKPVH